MSAKPPAVARDAELSGGTGHVCTDLQDLAAVAVALGASDVPEWTSAENTFARDLPLPSPSAVANARDRILAGEDPLGESFCAIRSREERRKLGATYTPQKIVEAMLAWASDYSSPDHVVDPGTGSGRFMVEAGRRFERAQLVGVELDPLAAILARGHIAAAGLAARSKVVLGDYRQIVLPSPGDKTLYIGNPPYVRHHLLSPRWKQWLVNEAKRRGLHASRLAGLHVHFFLATAAKAAPGDYGAFITAAEWLDVNYGRLLRELLLNGLGCQRIVVIEPAAMPFPDAATTGVITCFEVSTRPRSVFVQPVKKLDDLGRLNGGRRFRRERLESERRWSCLTRGRGKRPEGYVELGEICRVHRGQVTGANKIWIAGKHSEGLPECVLYLAVTRARQLFGAGRALDDPSGLRRVIDLPADLSELDPRDRRKVDSFLKKAKALGADKGYIAQKRKAWWSIGLREPAPILATYMARRSPAFVRNLVEARHINIAHGLYPRDSFSERAMRNLAEYLSTHTEVSDGRTYAGGLTKFEPREMERLLVPRPELLEQGALY